MPTVEELLATVGRAALALLLLALLFVPLERVFAARSQPRSRASLRVDLVYCAFQFIVMGFILIAFNDAVGALAGSVLPVRWLASIASWPWPVQVVVGIVLGDVVLYWGHRACHEVPVLWRIHAVHHSAQRLDWIAAHREHPLDGLFSQLCLTWPAAMLGIPIAVVGPIFMMRGLFATFVHSNVRIPLGPIGLLFGDPVLHRWHHARVDKCAHNFANVAPYLDVLFGTHFRPVDEDYPLGLHRPPAESFLAQLAAPFQQRSP